jgi:hypothetical protein
LRYVAAVPSLQVLSLRSEVLSDADLRLLAPLSRLQSLSIVGWRLSSGRVRALSALTALAHLEVSFHRVAPETFVYSLSLSLSLCFVA